MRSKDPDLIARTALERVFEEVTPGRGTSRADLLARHDGRRVAVELELLPTLRIADLEGRLARGVLKLRHSVDSVIVPVVLVVSRRHGARAERAAERFMAELAPDVGWGLVDEHEQLRLEVPTLGLSVRHAGTSPLSEARSTTANLFTDLNRWLLKVLLLRTSPEDSWGGPRDDVLVRNPTELHRIAGVSLEKSHRFARTFEAADFLRRTREGLRLVRTDVLLAQWLADESVRPKRRLPVRSLFRGEAELTELIAPLEQRRRRYAVGGFAACALLGVARTPRREIDLHVEDRAGWVMEIADLQPCDERDAALYIIPSRYPESVLRGVVTRRGLPVVDELQAALDVAADPGRGEEQARFIVDRVLSWGLRP